MTEQSADVIGLVVYVSPDNVPPQVPVTAVMTLPAAGAMVRTNRPPATTLCGPAGLIDPEPLCTDVVTV